MKPYESDKPVVLVGQPAGHYSFFRDVMLQLFGKKFLDLSNRPGTQVTPWANQPNRPDGRWLPQIDCVGGIFDSGAGSYVQRCCPIDSQFILMVADPFATAVETYYRAKLDSDSGRFWIRDKQSHIDVHFRSIDEYLERFPRFMYNHLPSDLTLENYQQRFSQHYVYVGPADKPKQSALDIANVVGRPINAMPNLPNSNRSSSIPEHLRSRFEYNFPLPCQIYRFARDFANN